MMEVFGQQIKNYKSAQTKLPSAKRGRVEGDAEEIFYEREL